MHVHLYCRPISVRLRSNTDGQAGLHNAASCSLLAPLLIPLPSPPPSHTTSAQSSPPSLITTVTVSHCVLSPRSLALHCHPIPSVLGQSDPIVDEHCRQFPHNGFPYLRIPVNHQIKVNLDCHFYPKSLAKPAQLCEFADLGRCLG